MTPTDTTMLTATTTSTDTATPSAPSRFLVRKLARMTWPVWGVVCVWALMAMIVLWEYCPVSRPAPTLLEGDIDKQVFPLPKLFGDTVASFRGDAAGLRNNMVAQCVFVVLGFFALASRAKEYELPVLRLKLPVSWVHYLIPISLFFLWLQFGFLLDQIINTRSEGMAILATINPMSSEWRNLIGGQLNDSSFVDAWFLLFRLPAEHTISDQHITVVIVLFSVVFGILLGMTHAMITGMLLHANASYRQHIKKLSRFPRVTVILLPWLALFLLLLSHRIFYLGGDNPNWFQAVIALVACIGTLVIGGLPDFAAEVSPPSTQPEGACRGTELRIRSSADGLLSCEVVSTARKE